jgi:adenylylsulfate kinase
MKKILIFGLPGAGKTTLANALAPKIGAVLFNADEVRKNINNDLGFSIKDRMTQASRMSWLCDQVCKAGYFSIADFVCPTQDTRKIFGECFSIFVDRIEISRFEDTNRIFEIPKDYNIRVIKSGSADEWASKIAQVIRNENQS